MSFLQKLTKKQGPSPLGSHDDLKKRLTPEQYRVTQEKGTEAPYTGAYCDIHEPGMYTCIVCGANLFDSETKFDSGSGWPSYFQPVTEDAISEVEDRSLDMVRKEVVCSKCGAHLGHVFDDGPKPTGKRYCINSAALHLQKK